MAAKKKELTENQRIRKLEQQVAKLEKSLAELSKSHDRYSASMFDDHEALLEYMDSLIDDLVEKDVLEEKRVDKWDIRYEKRMNAILKKLKKKA